MRPVLMVAPTLLLLGSISARAQFVGSGIVFDPTQSVHVIQQIGQAEKTYTTTVQTYEKVVNTYNLARRMASAPSVLYSGYGAGLPSWVPVVPSKDTYGNTNGWLQKANAGLNTAASAMQSASIPRVAKMTGYDKLGSYGQRSIAAQTGTVDLSDSIGATNLSAVNAIRSNQMQRQADIANLEAQSHSIDPSLQTEMATLQRINQALLLMLRTQQDQSQLAQGQTLQQIIQQKQQQDDLKSLFQAADGYETNYTSTAGSETKETVSHALRY